MNEFELISHYFKPLATSADPAIEKGIGDDAAVIALQDQQLLLSTDAFNQDVHFLTQWPAKAIAYRCLVAATSDLIAMGGTPKWYTCALSLPENDADFFADFASGLRSASQALNINLVGGDLTRAQSISITMTCLGVTAPGAAVCRSGARPGDAIYLSGDLGQVQYALNHSDSWGIDDPRTHKLMYPPVRLPYAAVLRQFAHAAIDISDGFSSDLHHLCQASGVGAVIDQAALPIAVTGYLPLSSDAALSMFLSSGDEFELLFTVDDGSKVALEQHCRELALDCHCIGRVTQGTSILLRSEQEGVEKILSPSGYLHF